MSAIALAISGYLLGSIPWSFIIARLFGVKDIRTRGSGNVGATNVMRSAGKVPGLLALLLDASKGALAVVLARAAGASETEVCVAGFAAVLGHLFPVWLGFRGGKGVATGAGLFLPLAPAAVGVAVIVFVVTLAVFRFVSLASILASAALPLTVLLSPGGLSLKLTAVAAGATVIMKHHANIGRLLRGEEPKVGARKA